MLKLSTKPDPFSRPISDFLVERGAQRRDADQVANAFTRAFGFTRAQEMLAAFLEAGWSADEISPLLTYENPAWRASPELLLAAEKLLSSFGLSPKSARKAVTIHELFGLAPAADLAAGLERLVSRGFTPDDLVTVVRKNPEAFYQDKTWLDRYVARVDVIKNPDERHLALVSLVSGGRVVLPEPEPEPEEQPRQPDPEAIPEQDVASAEVLSLAEPFTPNTETPVVNETPAEIEAPVEVETPTKTDVETEIPKPAVPTFDAPIVTVKPPALVTKEESEPPDDEPDDAVNAVGMETLIRETLERADREFSEKDWSRFKRRNPELFDALVAAARVWSEIRSWMGVDSRERFLAALLASPELQALLRLPREIVWIRMYVVRTHLKLDFVAAPEILLHGFEKITDVEWRYRMNVARQTLRVARKSSERWLAKDSSIRLLLLKKRDTFLTRLRRRAETWPRSLRSPFA